MQFFQVYTSLKNVPFAVLHIVNHFSMERGPLRWQHCLKKKPNEKKKRTNSLLNERSVKIKQNWLELHSVRSYLSKWLQISRRQWHYKNDHCIVKKPFNVIIILYIYLCRHKYNILPFQNEILSFRRYDSQTAFHRSTYSHYCCQSFPKQEIYVLLAISLS